MSTPPKPDMSCARVKSYAPSTIGAIERHNERKNESYDNINVELERVKFNVHYKEPQAESYMETLRKMEADGKATTRGLRKDATLFDKIIIDVNTMYFEKHGEYEYAREFYEEAFHFVEKKFGSENVISAVMHADEINKGASEDLGKSVYHYHLHAVVLPVVEKEILWSKRCKDEALRGTAREVVHQISHSKKWASNTPMLDEKGEVVLRQNGKPKFRRSYSILQDELFEHMQERGFKGFQRGELGSDSEHLTSLRYQINADKDRLAEIQGRIQQEQIKYEPAHEVFLTANEIEETGQKTLTRKISMSKEDYTKITALAKEGITSRGEVKRLNDSVQYYRNSYYRSASALDRMQNLYDDLKEKCKPFLVAMEHFPDLVKIFVDKVKELFTAKEEWERQEKVARDTARKQKHESTRSRDDWSR